MRYLEPLVALAVFLVLLPPLAAQYSAVTSRYREAESLLRAISDIRERLSLADERYGKGLPVTETGAFKVGKIGTAGGVFDAVSFSFAGSEYFWILGSSGGKR